MSKKVKLVLKRIINDDYCIRDLNSDFYISMCDEEFEKIVKINLKISYDVEYTINSIKFVGLRKANKDIKANCFLSKGSNYFEFWISNPTKLWDSDTNSFVGTLTYFGGIRIMSFNIKNFERMSGIRKQAILKRQDIYGFKRIDINISKIIK